MTQPPRADARRIEVDPARIARWVLGFAERHGAVSWEADGGDVALTAVDGATAVLSPLAPGPAPAAFEDLEEWAARPESVALVLVRRGGYAVGLASGMRLVAHKAGTRYVQSRTAAGGWSQQRYARRRGNQADALVEAVAAHTVRVLSGTRSDAAAAQPGPTPAALVVGGDRTLVRDVLAAPGLAGLHGLPRRELYDLPDPRLAVLEVALRRGRAVRVALREPAPG